MGTAILPSFLSVVLSRQAALYKIKINQHG